MIDTELNIPVFISFPSPVVSFSTLCHCLFFFFLNSAGCFFLLFFFRQTSILSSESAEQSALWFIPSPVPGLNKVVQSAVKPLGWAVPLNGWERTAN